jgi:hypothetical protein
MPCRPHFHAGPVRGIATIPWGSTVPSSGHWALVAGRTTMERCARIAGCRASHARSRRRASTAPGPSSLACGPREQASSLRRAGYVPHEPGREGHCRPRRRADFGPVAQGFKKNPFLLFEIIWTVLNFENSYLFVQSSKIYEISSIGFIIS